MLEQGFVQLVQSGLNNPNILGGYAVTLPPNCITFENPQAWSYRSIISTPLYTLNGQDSLTKWELQLDCVGFTMTYAITLAGQIQTVLSGGWCGVLSDPDSTVVQGIFALPRFADGYNPDNKTYVRILEYEVIFYQT